MHLRWKADDDAISCNRDVNWVATWSSHAHFWHGSRLAVIYTFFWLRSERWLRLPLLTLEVLYATMAIRQEIPHCMTVQLRMTIAVSASVTLYIHAAPVILTEPSCAPEILVIFMTNTSYSVDSKPFSWNMFLFSIISLHLCVLEAMQQRFNPLVHPALSSVPLLLEHIRSSTLTLSSRRELAR